jgi:myo-inositol-1(or 4)-monophosphatase
MTSDDAERALVARRAAEAGAEVALDGFRTGIDVETKAGKTDVVTQADRDAQRRVIEVVRESYVEDAVVGEEEEELKAVPESGAAWVIDPIDGTNNYVRNLRTWATSVAAVVDGEAVGAATVLPALGDTYAVGPDGATLNDEPASVSDRTDPETFAVAPTIWWDFDSRGEYAALCRGLVDRFADVRRVGCAQAVLGMVAAGQLEGAVTNVRVNPWDSVAGVAMVWAAGGVVTDLDGDRWEPGARGLVASNGEAHDLLLDAAREAEDAKT